MVRTPLLRLNVDDAPAEIYLKPENLQPVGSFKIRPAGNFISSAAPEALAKGVYTASSGNSGLGLAYAAKAAGVPARIIVPEGASPAKLAALGRLGATVRVVPFETWWSVILNRGGDDEDGLFFDAVRDPAALAGNGMIGREILEDLPDVECIVAPFGGGGLSVGIAMAARALKPDIKIIGAEIDTAMPLAAALKAGHPVKVPHRPSFIQAIGVDTLLDDMWPLVARHIDGAAHATLQETASAIRLLYERNRIIAEGAGAVALAATLAGRAGTGKIVCIISGGNIEPEHMTTILAGGVPGN